MSQENVKVVRRAVEQWQRAGGTPDAVPVEVYADDVEWDYSGYPTVDLPTRGSGGANLLDTIREYHSGWTSYEVEAREFIDAGENVVSVIREKARIGDSGAFLERDLFHVWTLSDGLVVKWRSFEAREQALEAAGLRE